MSTYYLLEFALLLLAIVVGFEILWPESGPPGPRRLPFLGNLHQLLRGSRFVIFNQFHARYGPIISIKIGQTKMIMLGKHDVAHELLSRKGAKYSSRPSMVMAHDMVTKGLHIGLMPDNPKWHAERRAVMSVLGPRAVQHYVPIYDIQSKQLIWELLHTNDFTGRFRRFANSLIFSLAYGNRLLTDEKIMFEAIRVSQVATEQLTSGITLIDQFPVLKWLPRFLSPWKRAGDKIHVMTMDVFTRLRLSGLENGSWNWTKKMVSTPSLNITDDELSYMLGVLIEAGSEPIITALRNVVLASLLYPACVRKVQAEVDRLVGTERLPTHEDMEKLPYTYAFILESLRWSPPTFTGVPHTSSEDGIYKGLHIPAGSSIVTNIRAMTVDEMYFPEPLTYVPERWIENPKLPVSVFGFGRRTCPGRHLVLKSMSLVTARLLWAFDVSPVPGHSIESLKKLENNPIDHGATQEPLPFEAQFTVRGTDRRVLVEEGWREAESTNIEDILNDIGKKI